MQRLRQLLYPFSMLYGGIMKMRNIFYDKEIFVAQAFDVPVIAVGNLSTGGTGKSPMIEYLLRHFQKRYRVASLSRGYKRKTTGYFLLSGNETVREVGDEPLQIKNKFPEAIVAVDEDRVHGIRRLLTMDPSPEVIFLDDAFQHRKVKASFYLLLTSYGQLYTQDRILPAGNLREAASGADRADAIVVTKCPENLSLTRQREIRKELKPHPHQRLYFSYIKYSDRICSSSEQLSLENLRGEKFTLVTGIANPFPLLEFLQKAGLEFEHLSFPDHHQFSVKEIGQMKDLGKILTTEKDFMRLNDSLSDLYFIPIETGFLPGSEGLEDMLEEIINKK